MRQVWIVVSGLIFLSACSGLVAQDDVSAVMRRLTSDGVAETVGTVSFRDSDYGLIIEPDLFGLPPGLIGTHIHQNPGCGPGADGTPGGNAGGHYDPDQVGVHLGPYANGHLGDLPNLVVERDGSGTLPVLAPRVNVSDLQGRSLILHEGKDDYKDHPGGARAYCGVIR